MSALKTVIRLVKAGNGTVIFPEGTRSRDGKLQPAQSGLGLIVSKTLVPVVPMRIFGAFEAFPAHARKLHLSPITVVIGKPMFFAPEDIAGEPKEVYRQISESVMARIAALQIPPCP